MIRCDICQKKMPETILARHKVKRHFVGVGEVVEIKQETASCDCPCQKKEICRSCGQEIVSILAFAHARVFHGV